MTSRTNGTLRRTATVAAATISIALGVAGTAHAAAPISYPRLVIYQGTCAADEKRVFMDASSKMSRADAQRFVDDTGSIRIRLKGDDWSDNTQLGPVNPKHVGASDSGLYFWWAQCVSHKVLNEDPASGDQDELYAEFTLRDPRDGKTTTAKSPNVNGHY